MRAAGACIETTGLSTATPRDLDTALRAYSTSSVSGPRYDPSGPLEQLSCAKPRSAQLVASQWVGKGAAAGFTRATISLSTRRVCFSPTQR